MILAELSLKRLAYPCFTAREPFKQRKEQRGVWMLSSMLAGLLTPIRS